MTDNLHPLHSRRLSLRVVPNVVVGHQHARLSFAFFTDTGAVCAF